MTRDSKKHLRMCLLPNRSWLLGTSAREIMITMETCQPRSLTAPSQNAGIFRTITIPNPGRFLVSTITHYQGWQMTGDINLVPRTFLLTIGRGKRPAPLPLFKGISLGRGCGWYGVFVGNQPSWDISTFNIDCIYSSPVWFMIFRICKLKKRESERI